MVVAQAGPRESPRESSSESANPPKPIRVSEQISVATDNSELSESLPAYMRTAWNREAPETNSSDYLNEPPVIQGEQLRYVSQRRQWLVELPQ